MTITILVTNDTLSPTELQNNIIAANHVVAKWSPAWGVTAVVTSDASIKADMIANITDKNRIGGDKGYHSVDIKSGIPVAWISPSACGHRPYGTYIAPRYGMIKNLLGRFVKSTTPTTPATFTSGISSVLVHEILEMLADARLDKVSPPDSNNDCWMLEVCDHVAGGYSVEVVNGINIVVPDATLPSYYQLKGSAPFSIYGTAKTPFDTNSPSFYGYWVDARTKVKTAIQKGSIHH